MLLQNKNAIIYGAGGSIGGAVARSFAREGATVFLVGRNLASLQPVADDIMKAGGKAEVASVDAMNEKSVNDHIDSLVSKNIPVDISFNAIGLESTQDIPLVEMSLDDFVRPVNIAMQTQFLTATAAGRVMMKQQSGVILSITATPGGIGYPRVGGFGPACNAIEGFSGNLASELGPHGIRVVNIRSAGSPDSRVFREALDTLGEVGKKIIHSLEADTMLKKLPSIADIGNVASFLASDLSGKITGVTIDVTCGTTSALNHKTSNVPFGK